MIKPLAMFKLLILDVQNMYGQGQDVGWIKTNNTASGHSILLYNYYVDCMEYLANLQHIQDERKFYMIICSQDISWKLSVFNIQFGGNLIIIWTVTVTEMTGCDWLTQNIQF